jgi:hypothetical protein
MRRNLSMLRITFSCDWAHNTSLSSERGRKRIATDKDSDRGDGVRLRASSARCNYVVDTLDLRRSVLASSLYMGEHGSYNLWQGIYGVDIEY